MRVELGRGDVDALRGLRRDLGMIDIDGPSLCNWLAPRLLSTLGTCRTVVYVPEVRESAFQMRDYSLAGDGQAHAETVRRLYEAHQRRVMGVYSFYDPVHVERGQRDQVMLVGKYRDLLEGEFSGPLARIIPRSELELRGSIAAQGRAAYELWGVLDDVTLRALICDGQRMLGYVGALQPDGFDRRTKPMFDGLVPALRRRFLLEERLRIGGGIGLTMALLEQIAGAVYLLDGKNIVACNTRGRAAIDRDPRRARKLVEIAKRGGDAETTVVDLTSRGVPKHSLLIVRSAPEPLPDALVVIARRHRLTPREAAVLLELGKGRTNRAISVALGCAERTVETHVSRILHKTDCASRAELVALAWSVGATPPSPRG